MSRRPLFTSPGHAKQSACACVSVKHTAVCGTCVSPKASAAPETAWPGTVGPSWVREVLRARGATAPCGVTRPHSSFPVSQAKVPFDLRSLTGLLLGNGIEEPFTALSRTLVFACATWSRVSPPHLVVFTAPLRPASTCSPGSPLKTGPRSSATSGRSPPLGSGFFHLPRPQGPGRLGPGHIEGRRGSQHPNRRKNRRMNQAAGQGWGAMQHPAKILLETN